MKIDLVGSTNNIASVPEALDFARAAARICYSKYDFKTLVEEEGGDLVEKLLNSGHQSPFDHIVLNMYLEDLPKFGAMILNNERMCTTSEKSARYTKMKVNGEQKVIYEKWQKKLEEIIHKEYPKLDDKKVQGLAQENARYLISVFTPTKMLHTISFRQLSYIVHWFNDYIKNEPDTLFSIKVKEFMDEFINANIVKQMYIERLNPEMKKRELSIFAKRTHEEHFGETYTTNYEGSFAQLAQAHRHRTLKYKIEVLQENLQNFTPPILFKYPELVNEWTKDFEKVSENDFPQGTLVRIYESGDYQDFISKLNERACGHAQWEVMNQTLKTLEKYLNATQFSNPEVHEILLPYSQKPKCKTPNGSCQSKCPYGPNESINRII